MSNPETTLIKRTEVMKMLGCSQVSFYRHHGKKLRPLATGSRESQYRLSDVETYIANLGARG